MYAFKYTFNHAHIDFKERVKESKREKSIYVNGRPKVQILCILFLDTLRYITNIYVKYLLPYMLYIHTAFPNTSNT